MSEHTTTQQSSEPEPTEAFNPAAWQAQFLKRVTIPLDEAGAVALVRLARAHWRTPKAEAQHQLAQALARELVALDAGAE